MLRKSYTVERGGLHPERSGRVTASVSATMMSKPSTKGYQTLVNRIAAERITGQSISSGFQSAAMARGHELEPLAVAEYEAQTFNAVVPGGFYTLGDMLGASPDGLVGDDGLLEVKSPIETTQIEYLRKGTLPSVYRWQVHQQLLVTDRDFCDFVSFCPELPLMIVRVERDPEMDEQILKAAEQVGAEITKIMTDLTTKGNLKW